MNVLTRLISEFNDEFYCAFFAGHEFIPKSAYMGQKLTTLVTAKIPPITNKVIPNAPFNVPVTKRITAVTKINTRTMRSIVPKFVFMLCLFNVSTFTSLKFIKPVRNERDLSYTKHDFGSLGYCFTKRSVVRCLLENSISIL